MEQEFAGRVAVGQTATIQDDTTTTTTWHGKVIRVSDWYTQRRTILPEPIQLHDIRTLECIVELDAGHPAAHQSANAGNAGEMTRLVSRATTLHLLPTTGILPARHTQQGRRPIMETMTYLLVATGFTGALTLVFVLRRIHQWLVRR